MNVPIRHAEQPTSLVVVAAVVTYDPAAQGITDLHALNPDTSANVDPTAHAVHDAALVVVVAVPAEQLVHTRLADAVPAVLMNVPAAHV